MRRRMVRAIVALALGAGLGLPSPCPALTIAPGGALELPFSLTAPAPGADTVTFRLVNVVANGVSTLTVRLYDGATLLGSVSGVPVTGIAAFVDAGSLWTTNAVSADLSAVRAGTIAGRLVVTPDFSGAGSLDADVSAVTSLALGHGSDVATLVPASGVLSIGAPHLVPEAGALALLAPAALLCAFRLDRPTRNPA